MADEQQAGNRSGNEDVWLVVGESRFQLRRGSKWANGLDSTARREIALLIGELEAGDHPTG